MHRALRLAFYGVGLFVLFGCTSAAGLGGDAGGPTNGGTVSMKSPSFSGTTSAGRVSFVLANDSNADVDGLVEVKVTTASGVLTFPGACTKCTTDAWCVKGGKSANVTLDLTALDTTGRGTVTTTCKGAPYALAVTSDSPAASTADTPTSISLKGGYVGGTPWTTTATFP